MLLKNGGGNSNFREIKSFISFVESGGDLSMGTGSKSGQQPIAPTLQTTHFAATGRFFMK